MKRTVCAIFIGLTSMCAMADKYGVSESDGSSSSHGPVSGIALIGAIAGAALGYWVEREFYKSDLRKHGETDFSGFLLGGKMGAIVGAIIGGAIGGLLS